MAKALLFTHQRDQVARKASDVSAFDWLYQTHVKNIVFFARVLFQFYRGWKSLYNTAVYMINSYKKYLSLNLSSSRRYPSETCLAFIICCS